MKGNLYFGAELCMTAPAASIAPAAHAKDFADVFSVVSPHMARLDAFLREQIAAFEPEIRDMADYCIDTSGKRIRPALVFFAGMTDKSAPDELVRVAAVVELVHLATLVHDDIMDGADVRRGRPSAARKFGPTPAVLLGDALFAHALYLAASFPTPEVCRAVSESTRRVCAGEIVQTLRRRTTAVTREDYDRVIDLKTAELFRVSCALGAKFGGYSEEFAAAAACFGRHLGIAYQIYDDLVDFYGREQRIGKTLGTDLASGKLTLPLIVLRARLSATEAAELEAELLGRAAPRFDHWLARMKEHDVFSAVCTEVERELAKGEGALEPYGANVAARHLSALPLVLRAQISALAA